jgi:cyclic beta-1,2-glucan synthetase
MVAHLPTNESLVDELGRMFSSEHVPLRHKTQIEIGAVDVARTLSGTWGPTTRRPASGELLKRVRENHQAILDVYRELTVSTEGGEQPSPEAEWLLDNFHVIDDVFREVVTHLPQKYYNELPVLSDGPLIGLPRTYAFAVAVLVHSDSAVAEVSLREYVRDYQHYTPLSIGELWALPIMLRVGLLESLARLARQLRAARAERALAHQVVHRAAAGDAIELPERPSDAYVVGVLHALRELHEVRADLDEQVRGWLAHQHGEPDEVLRRDNQRQAGNQVSIGNAVTSLRLLEALDWAAFFEDLSLTEQMLRSEPTGAYRRQTFATRDAYRTAVEKLSRGSGVAEVEVARRAIKLAAAGTTPATGHVGHYLVGDGRRELIQDIRYRPAFRDRLRAFLLENPNLSYFGLMALFVAAFVAVVMAVMDPPTWPLALAVAAVAFLPATEVAVAVLNFVVCRLLPPRVLPRLDFRDGVPDDCETFVVIPSMLTSPASAKGLLDRLELHYLANPDPNFVFAILTDFADAPSETMPDDTACVQAALDGVRALNEKHAAGGPPRFFVLHRRRQFNAAEGVWMGWERKRGKLHEFNRLVRGATDTSYATCSSDPATLPRTRYVMTLDSDTVLPRDALRVLVGTLAHPLNQARLSADGRRVEGGYSILQPRVSFLYKTGFRSLFARLYAYSAGIDPYSAAVSDTYMDLYGRGTFTGKGLYDVDAFEATAGRAFPDNHVLSHDLIESTFARCGLVSDVEVFDDFPARYAAYSRREHRWARGDWQLLPWLTPRVPTAHDGKLPNPLPLLERWKVADNLRRTLVPAAMLLMLALGWTVLPGGAWAWSLVALVVVATPLVLHVFGSFLAIPAIGVRQSWVNARAGLLSTVGQVALGVAFLAHQAWSLLDAIGRTLWRLFVSRRHLLEWETAATTEARLGAGFRVSLRQMWTSPVIAVGLTVLLGLYAPAALPAAVAFLLAWFCAPLVAWFVSRPTPQVSAELSAEDRRFLRRYACKTWGFFEQFVGDEDNWLPPDNYQETPVELVAHRTSPTNMGLLLTSTLAAHDLGYVTLPDLVERLKKSFATFDRLERFHGHFLNWYETHTLAPLPPAYVSSVDSGNLMGCLLTLAQGLEEKAKGTIPSPVAVDGLRDRLELLRERLEKNDANGPLAQAAAKHLASPAADLTDWAARLDQLALVADRLTTNPDATTRLYAERFAAAVREQREELDAFYPDRLDSAKPATLAELAAKDSESYVARLAEELRELAETARRFVDEMDFSLVFNPTRQLFAIGYHVPRQALDTAHYDLLASESCITSFLAVARGVAPRKHWFRLSRPFVKVADRTGLMSWSGTMFEYLMPRLFLPVPKGTLLDATWQAAVARQIEYGRQTRVPWGISESAYNLTDRIGQYQYQAFGVPGLGLKRGLGRDLVVAPYATVLAVGVATPEAIANIQRLADTGAEGPFGLYEAIDYTPDRLPRAQRQHVIRSYMAHHQGMCLLALDNVLNADIMPARLAREPMVRAVDLLLQERVPLDAPVVPNRTPEALRSKPPTATDAVSRRLTTPTPREPRAHLLSNGRYGLMMTSSGSGYSRRGDLAVARWRADGTADAWGQFCYVRVLDTGEAWSAGHQPVCKPADDYEAIYSVDKIELRRRDGEIETLLEVAVSPEADAEVRRVTVTNFTGHPRDIEFTSYAEVVLAPHAADVAHPAFQKLFVQTKWLDDTKAVVAMRRPRAADQPPTWGVHVLATEAELLQPPTCETDRARFVGRRGTLANPAALAGDLSGTTGPVLDPVFSIRCRVRVPATGRVTVCFTTAVANSEEEAVAVAHRFHAPAAVDRTFELAWAHSRVELKHFNTSIREAQLYQRLAGVMLFPTPALRASAECLMNNHQGQSGLWRHGISGDLPVVLLHLTEGPQSMELLKRLLTAHSYWRSKGLLTDLVILNEMPTSYQDSLADEVMGLIRAGEARDRIDRPGGVFVRKTDQFSPQDRALLQCWARVALDGRRGSLEDQIGRTVRAPRLPAAFAPTAKPGESRRWAETPGDLQFFNGVGGFSADGREYVIVPRDAAPPMPWANVIANPDFGFLVTDSGGGYAWAGNCQLNRLTPWGNDPVSDAPGEVLYVRDEQTGEVWTPTPLPAGGHTLVRHGAGYTVFASRQGEIDQELTVFVPPTDPVKVNHLRLTNRGPHRRKLRVTYYVEWVLGTNRDITAQQVLTEVPADWGVVLARNPAKAVAPQATAFAAANVPATSVTVDRTEFLGRCGSVARPAALSRASLSGQTGPTLDPCAALQVVIELGPGDTYVFLGLLGEAPDLVKARELIAYYRDPNRAAESLAAVRRRWDELLDAVQVRTPSAALNLLLNRWLLYQTVSSRLWGRTGFYQSGGAYGFRDQLQDVMALVHAAPKLTREQLLRAARRQFPEGDVQHWWHPPAGNGVRTRFSDDFLWLPLVACHYVTTTGDATVLDEVVPFLDAPLLEEHQEESYTQPRVSAETATLYEHCVRSLENGWKLGAHGLPLMGVGDWNDGMNKVGAGGKGESVWVAWFQAVCLDEFAKLAESRQDADRARICRERAKHLIAAAEEAWDGKWYRRAYFDDGTPLGSAENDECRIDSLAQSWAVIAGGDRGRATRAVGEAVRQLVRPDDGIVLLFDPPFDSGKLQPGYIKGYLPGTRENGGQYTHAAIWLLRAVARLRQADAAWQLCEMLNPILDADTPADVATYKVEPYVVAADVYGRPPHVGRGGWTWYTGSAGWLYQVFLEDILGVRRVGDRLAFAPCVPAAWAGFEVRYRFGSSVYEIRVEGPTGSTREIEVDGQPVGGELVLRDDNGTHRVVVRGK